MSERPDPWSDRSGRWRVERLDPALARLPERRDGFVTLGDIPIERLYGPWDLDGEPGGEPAGPGGPTAVDHHGDPLRDGPGEYAAFDPVRDIGFPGEPPFTRGVHPTGYRSRPWTMRMFAGFGSAEDTNARFRQLLDAGQTGLSVAYDMPTLYG
jgi:methylmalonyl-CoA mutase N-terminal domain/subunit